MKKLLGIVALSLLFVGSVYAKDVKLICKGINNDGISHIFIINDKKKIIKYEVNPGYFEDLDVDIFNNNEIDANVVITLDGKPAQQIAYNIDRRSGVLFYRSFFFNGGGYQAHRSNCEVLTKNKF